MAHLGVVRFSLSFPDPLGSRLLLCVPWSPKARVKGGRFLSTPGVFPTLGGTPAPDLSPRRPLALPSSRVTPVEACPALRPRWCPVYSPYRIQDCCLPVTAHRRLLPRSRWGYPTDHDSTYFGALSRGLLPRSLQLRTPITGCARGVRSWPAG